MTLQNFLNFLASIEFLEYLINIGPKTYTKTAHTEYLGRSKICKHNMVGSNIEPPSFTQYHRIEGSSKLAQAQNNLIERIRLLFILI